MNSYAVPSHINCIATVNYGDELCAIVKKDNVIGFQFHPEKSGDVGKIMIQNFLNVCKK